VKVDEEVGVRFIVGLISARVLVGVGLSDGIKIQQASKINIIGSKTRGRGLEFIYNNVVGLS
jgi:hypothetical protein